MPRITPSSCRTNIKPWGHWLVPVSDERGRIVSITDRAGVGSWPGVREAYWTTALNMCGCSSVVVNQQLGRMAEVLLELGKPIEDRAALKLFGDKGSVHYMLYLYWLSEQQLIVHGGSPFDRAKLSELGLSVLEMIRLTQPEEICYGAHRWFPAEKREPAPRFQRRMAQKLLPAPAAA